MNSSLGIRVLNLSFGFRVSEFEFRNSIVEIRALSPENRVSKFCQKINFPSDQFLAILTILEAAFYPILRILAILRAEIV